MSPRPTVLGRLDDVRGYLSRLALVGSAAWSLAAVAAVFVAAWLMGGPGGWRQGTVVPLGLFLLAVVAAGLGIVVYRRIEASLEEPTVARAMDRAADLPGGTVLGSVELARAVPPGVSPALSRLALEGVGGHLAAPAPRLSGTLGERLRRVSRNGLVAFAVLSAGLAAMLVASPARSMAAWRGVIAPFGLLSEPRLPPMLVSPGSAEVPRGDQVAVAVEAPQRERVTVFWQAAGDVVRSQEVVVRDGVGAYALPAVGARTEYWVRDEAGGRSEVFTLTPVDPLIVSTFLLEVTFPPHTGRPPEEYRSETPVLTVPVGARVRVEGTASRPLGQAALTNDDGDGVEFAVQGAAFAGEWRPARSGSYVWRFGDPDGQAAEVFPDPVQIQLVADSVPVVSFAFPARDTVLPVNDRQPLVIEARDDYGLRRLELVSRRVSSFGEADAPVLQQIALEGSRAVLARPVLDVGSWDLLPGDTVRYRARVVDNAPRGQAAETREYVLVVPRASELEREAQERLDDAARRLEEISEQASTVQEETRELDRQADQRQQAGQPGDPSGDEADFQEREDLRQAMERQEVLNSAVDSLQRELSDLRESLEDAGLADPELEEDLSELQESLDDVTSEDMQQQMEQLEQGLDEMGSQEMSDQLEELARNQEEFWQRLEESLQQLRQAAIEQDFRATTQEAGELAQQENALADAMREGDDPARRTEQQQELEARAEALDEQMETLQERLEESGEARASEQVQEARNQAEQARQSMSEARNQSQAGDTEAAGAQADRAASEMQEAADQLQQSQQEMGSEIQRQIERALQETANDALALSRRQAELREEMRGATSEELAGMRADEAALAQGIQNLAENFASGTQMAVPGGREVLESAGQALEALAETIDAMQGRRGAASPTGAAAGVIEALNQVAMRAMGAGQQGGGEGQGGGEQMMEQLQQVAQQQGQVMNQAGSLSPMELGDEALQNQLEELAQEQEEVAEELGRMSDEEGEGPEDESLGDLEALAEEAAALARSLAGGRLDPETLRRQERLFHRLLDAGRSLERDEESEERESEQPGDFERGDVAPLTPDVLDALRFQLPSAEVLQSLPPAQRALVIRYFERLNRGPGGDGPGGGGGVR